MEVQENREQMEEKRKKLEELHMQLTKREEELQNVLTK